jgi:hypothetical protein
VRAWHTMRPDLRDIVITGTGLVIVWSQLLLWAVRDREPSTVLLAVGLAFTVPSAAVHVRAVLGAPDPGSSSPSSPSPPQPPSSPSPLPEVGSGE